MSRTDLSKSMISKGKNGNGGIFNFRMCESDVAFFGLNEDSRLVTIASYVLGDDTIVCITKVARRVAGAQMSTLSMRPLRLYSSKWKSKFFSVRIQARLSSQRPCSPCK